MSVKTMARFSVRSAGSRASSDGDGEVRAGEGTAASREDMVVLGPRPAEGTRHARGPGPVGARVTQAHANAPTPVGSRPDPCLPSPRPAPERLFEGVDPHGLVLIDEWTTGDEGEL